MDDEPDEEEVDEPLIDAALEAMVDAAEAHALYLVDKSGHRLSSLPSNESIEKRHSFSLWNVHVCLETTRRQEYQGKLLSESMLL